MPDVHGTSLLPYNSDWKTWGHVRPKTGILATLQFSEIIYFINSLTNNYIIYCAERTRDLATFISD